MRSFLALGLLVVTGCIHVHVSTTKEPKGGLGLEPGDRVVSRWRNAFWEATVITVNAKLVEVAWDTPPPPTSQLPRDWIVKLDEPVHAKPGDWVLCNDQKWQLCRVDGDALTTLNGTSKTRIGTAKTLAEMEVLPLPVGLVDWARRIGERALEQSLLTQTLGGLVPRAIGQPIESGQRVLAMWSDGNWWEGTVVRMEADGVIVRWGDNSGEQKVPPSSVAPITRAHFQPNDLAICKWSRAARWWRARVRQVLSDGLLVTYIDGTESRVLPSQCVAAVDRSLPTRTASRGAP